MKLFLKGERCLTEKCAIERRSYPPGEHGRGRIKQSEYLLQLREKQKARRYYGLLEKQFRTYYEKALAALRHHGREPAAHARDAARQRRLPARLRRLARAGAAARPPRPLPRERPPREHPELPGASPTTSITIAPGSSAEQVVRDATDLTASVAPWLQADHDGLTGQDPQVAGARRDRHAGAGAADRRALLEVTQAYARKGREWPLARL